MVPVQHTCGAWRLTHPAGVGFSGAMAEFTTAVENYDRFMGRYAAGLAPKLADAAGVRAGMRVVDVGCGPGALAVELAGRVGEDHVAAIDPAPQFAAACRARIPGADVREGVAESLPWDDGTFDAAMCSLVVAWMSDADRGIEEMARVTKPGGTVAAAMWDFPGGGLQMLTHFWRAALCSGRVPQQPPTIRAPCATHRWLCRPSSSGDRSLNSQWGGVYVPACG